MPEEPRLGVRGPERLAQERIGLEIDLSDGEVVRRAPTGVQQVELVAGQGHGASPGRRESYRRARREATAPRAVAAGERPGDRRRPLPPAPPAEDAVVRRPP